MIDRTANRLAYSFAYQFHVRENFWHFQYFPSTLLFRSQKHFLHRLTLILLVIATAIAILLELCWYQSFFSPPIQLVWVSGMVQKLKTAGQQSLEVLK